jgi:hypothetical protein
LRFNAGESLSSLVWGEGHDALDGVGDAHRGELSTGDGVVLGIPFLAASSIPVTSARTAYIREFLESIMPTRTLPDD